MSRNLLRGFKDGIIMTAIFTSPIIPFLILALSCSVLLNGCLNHSRLPSEGEERLIQQHSGVIVLLRLRTIVDGKPREDITLREKNEKVGFGFAVEIGRLETGQSPDLTIKRPDAALISPSAEARRQGWIYYVLPPGTYYLTVYDMDKKASLAPGFLLSVSGEKRVVYAGTLDIACKPPGFLSGALRECSGVSLTDEGDRAKVLAQAHFAQHGPISTSLMSKYDETVAASQRPAIFPMGYVTTAGTKDLRSPEWVKRSIGRAAPPEATELAAGLLQVPGGGLFTAAYVAYLPVGLIAGAIAGKSAEKKWQPCLQELAQEIKEIDPATALQRKLNEELKKFHASKTVALPPEGDLFQVAHQQGVKSLLQAEVTRIQIRECLERSTFCIEVAVRTRLWKVPDKSLYLDKVLVYTSSTPYERMPSEIRITGSSPCRKMDLYCGPGGKQIFREEIAAAIHNLVEGLLIEVRSGAHVDSTSYLNHSSPPATSRAPKIYYLGLLKYKNVKVIINDEVKTEYASDGVPLLESRLKGELRSLGYSLVEQGEDLTVHLKITSFSPGNRAVRMTVGFGAAGQATLNFKASFLDKSGSTVAEFSGGKAITGMDLAGTFQGEKRLKETLVQESVNQIGKFIKDYQ